jgi:hypothetical protein
VLALSLSPISFRALAAVVAVGACSACSAPALIPASDPAFARASERLERTTGRLDASGATPRERALFLQAEAMYRYRFEGARSRSAVATEALAAATDLPILQSFSGSLDLADLRVRSADAAIQLWETFAARYPTSALRPFALYRLGFAYRSAGIAGLPRASGDEAWDELSRGPAQADLVAAQASARGLGWKSKSAAAAWSLVPGLGQFYVGEPFSGSIRVGVALAAAAAIVVPAVIAASRASDLRWGRDWPLLASSAAGLIVLSFDYTSSYEDAMRGVVRWNERVEQEFEDAHPDAP